MCETLNARESVQTAVFEYVVFKNAMSQKFDRASRVERGGVLESSSQHPASTRGTRLGRSSRTFKGRPPPPRTRPRDARDACGSFSSKRKAPCAGAARARVAARLGDGLQLGVPRAQAALARRGLPHQHASVGGRCVIRNAAAGRRPRRHLTGRAAGQLGGVLPPPPQVRLGGVPTPPRRAPPSPLGTRHNAASSQRAGLGPDTRVFFTINNVFDDFYSSSSASSAFFYTYTFGEKGPSPSSLACSYASRGG